MDVFSDTKRRRFYSKRNDGDRPGVSDAPGAAYRRRFSKATSKPYRGGTRKGQRVVKRRVSKGVSLKSHRASVAGAASKFLGSTHDYLMAYGSPFCDQVNFKVGLPRVPDDAYTGTSASVMFQTAETVAESGPNLVISRSARMYGWQGCDIVGGMSLQFSQVDDPAQVAGSNGFRGMVQVLQARFLKNKNTYIKWRSVVLEQSAARYVGAGMKIHDLGAVQSQSGQVLATHCGADFLPNLYNTLFANTTDRGLLRLCNTYGIWALFAVGKNIAYQGQASGTGMTVVQYDKAAVVDLIKSIADENQVPLGNKYQEFLTGDGVSMRAYTGGTDRSFTTFAPPIIFGDEPPGTINRNTINRAMNANGYPGNDFFDDYVVPVFYEQAFIVTQAQAAASALSPTYKNISWASDNSIPNMTYTWVVVEWDYSINGGSVQTCSQMFLCDIYGVPISCYRHASISGLDNQSDAPFMMAFLYSQPSDRSFKLYGQAFEEIQPQSGSVLGSTPSPQDAAWREVVRISSGFPAIVKGFTFFSKLWDGVKDSVKFVSKNAGSIVKFGKLIATSVA